MSEIRVLDKHTAELIAAGEVIERPASVVKELVENSVDAGALHITVEIKKGGIELIRVTDDGKGIAPDDAQTAFLRHATSKVHTAADLESIGTLGFRGEALASICAVSRVSLLTRQRDSEIGCRLELAGGEVTLNEPAGCPVGTTIIVKNLFYNTPARMKFLKKDVSEANAVAAILEKIAVSNPQISFKFIRDGRVDLQTVGDGQLQSAVYGVFGKAFFQTLLPVDFNRNGVKVSGFISKALAARGKRGMQYFFLNGRTIKSPTMTVALEEAYKGSIMVGKFPACVLLLTVSPSIVDVNVHPTKTEVRFSDDRVIFDAVYFAAKAALSGDGAEASIPLTPKKPQTTPFYTEKGVGFTAKSEQLSLDTSKTAGKNTQITAAPPQSVSFSGVSAQDMLLQDTTLDAIDTQGVLNLKKWPKPSEEKKQTAIFSEQAGPEISEQVVFAPFPTPSASTDKQDAVSMQDTASEQSAPRSAKTTKEDRFDDAKILGELFETYILLQSRDALYLVDKHAAHERLIYNRLKAQGDGTCRQYLLEPLTVKFSRDEYDALISCQETVARLGFEIDDFGGGNLIIRALPPFTEPDDAAVVLSEIAGNLLSCKKDVTPQVLDRLYHTIACRSAVKAHDRSGCEELSFLIDCLRQEADVKFCPHGRPVTAKITKSEIERRFGRIQ